MGARRSLTRTLPLLALAALPLTMRAEVITNFPSVYEHTIDGQFTDWNVDAPPAQYEWFDIHPVKDKHPTLGLLAYVYDDYQADGWLYKLNDWVISNSANNVTDDNQFFFRTQAHLWMLTVTSVPGGKVVTCVKDGQPCNPNEFHGDYNVVATPNKQLPHSVWEVSLFLGPGITSFREWRRDPPCAGCPLVGGPGEHIEIGPEGEMTVSTVPEPGSALLVCAGLSLLVRRQIRMRRKQA